MTAPGSKAVSGNSVGRTALIDHRACGGGGCKSCRNTGTATVECHAPHITFKVRSDAEGFEEDRQNCPCYEGFKINDGVDQCTHPDNRLSANWCETYTCPLLRTGAKTP